jgi:hypothetical protein
MHIIVTSFVQQLPTSGSHYTASEGDAEFPINILIEKDIHIVCRHFSATIR